MQLPLLKVIFGVVVGHGCWWLVVGICRVTPWILAIAGLFALGFELSECHDSLERIPDLAPVPAERLPLLVSSFDYSVLLILVLKRREVVLLTALVDLLKAFEVVPEDFDGLVASGSRMAECQMKPRTKGVINRSDRVSGEKTNPRVALEDSQKRQRLGRYCWTSRCCFFFCCESPFQLPRARAKLTSRLARNTSASIKEKDTTPFVGKPEVVLHVPLNILRIVSSVACR